MGYQASAVFPLPLPLPYGLSAERLAWDQSQEEQNASGDAAWLVEASASDGSCSSTWVLGKPSVGRHLCLHRFKLWWLKPSHGHSAVDVPPETSLLLAERSSSSGSNGNGTKDYAILLPLCDTHARSSLHRAGGDADTSVADVSALALSADTGDDAVSLPETLGVLLVATGADPFRLARRLVSLATKRLRAQLLSGGRNDDEDARPGPVARFVDTFGWCTWDSFYTMVTPEGVLDGLSRFHKKGVRPRWVVIDDGWQRTTNDDALNTEQWDERLVGLEANKRFRRADDEGKVVLDLGDTVSRMKSEYGVAQVLTWHAMTGYWAGVEPEADEIRPFQPFVAKLLAPEGIRKVDPEMQPELDEKRFGMLPLSKIEAFYRAYHGYLKNNGVDGVKVDAQAMLDCMGGGNGGVPAVVRAYHDGLHCSVAASFKEGSKPAALMHCMCHAPSILYHIAAVSRDQAVIRGSDDFYPREPSSHGPHLYTNAYNALLISNLGIQDWDMFQSGIGCKHEGLTEVLPEAVVESDIKKERKAPAPGTKISWFHAAARAVSGGPVYVSDRLDQHNTDILHKLVLDDGSVLRAHTNALPTLDCLMRNPQLPEGGLLQIWALNALPGTGVLGSFNIRGATFSQAERTWVSLEGNEVPSVRGTVSPSDVHAFLKETLTKPGDIIASNMNGTTGDRQEDRRQEERAVVPRAQRLGMKAEPTYAVYLHRRREASVVRLTESLPIELDALAFELATFSRVLNLGRTVNGNGSPHTVHTATAGGAVLWAAIGLSNMLNSSAAITSQELVLKRSLKDEQEQSGFPVFVKLAVKGSGRFLALASRRPERVVLLDKTSDDNLAGHESGVELDVSFSALPKATARDSDSGQANKKGMGGMEDACVDRLEEMGGVEVDIPGPWDGRERLLVFAWA